MNHPIRNLIIIAAMAGLTYASYYNNKKKAMAAEKKTHVEKKVVAKPVTLTEYEKKKLKREQEKKRKAEEEALELARLEQERIDQELLAQQEEEKLAAQLAEIKEKQVKQKEAWTSYIGTDYDELKLPSGKVLEKAKVSEVRATHVTFEHRAGIANVKFHDLSEDIQKKCKYDPQLAKLAKIKEDELQERIRARISQTKATGNKRSKSKTRPKTTGKSSHSKSRSSKAEEEAEKPKGSLKVRVVGVDTDGIRDRIYSGRNKRDGARKIIEIKAYANVDATVVVEGHTSYSLTAKQPLVEKLKLKYSQYTVILKDKKGNILSTQKHNRKEGL